MVKARSWACFVSQLEVGGEEGCGEYGDIMLSAFKPRNGTRPCHSLHQGELSPGQIQLPGRLGSVISSWTALYPVKTHSL